MANLSTRPPQTSPPGINIWRLRVARGWSMRALADHCKPALDHTTVRRVEHNAGFTQDTLERIAAALGVPLLTLLLPPELEAWGQLAPDSRERLAHLMRDTLDAQRLRQQD